MRIFSKINSRSVLTLVLLTAVLFVFVLLLGGNTETSWNEQSDCTDCSKKRAGLYPGQSNIDSKTGTPDNDGNYFGRIFALLSPGIGDSDENIIIERDPEKDKTVNEINALSEVVCNEENLPGDVWISPKLIEKDAGAHKKELEKLIVYCTSLKNGKATSADKKEYYRIKIKLLEERRDLIKYYIDTLDGQIEDANEKKIAEIEDRKAGDMVSPEEEKQNKEIEKEMNRFFEEASSNSSKVINQINSVISNYQKELNKL